MIRIAAILALLLCATHAQARTLYVSLTGSHDTNAPAFGTWATAATNIQAAIDAASEGDTVRIAHGTYTAGAVGSGTYGAIRVRKSSLTLQGGRGTLWDADKTILRRSGTGYLNGLVIQNGAAGVTVKGLTFIGSNNQIIDTANSVDATLDSIIVRGNTPGSYFCVRLGQGATLQNSLVVGNQVAGSAKGMVEYTYSGTDMTLRNCIVEANSGVSIYGSGLAVGNSIYGWTETRIINLGGNITNQTTNSVSRLLDICPNAMEWHGDTWPGVAAYIPRLGSLAQGAGVGYAGIDTAKSGDGGPVLVPAGAKFLGRDSSTNGNHGAPIGGVTASTNSPFAGGGSAAFSGASAVVSPASYSLPVTYDLRFRSPSYAASQIVFSHGPTLTVLGVGSTAIYYSHTVATRGSTRPFNTNEWVHAVIAVETNNVATVYFNGVEASYIANDHYGSPAPLLTIGRRAESYPLWFAGNVAEFRVWSGWQTNRAHGATATNALMGNEEGLLVYYRFDEDVTTNYIDAGPFNLRNPLNHPTYMEAF